MKRTISLQKKVAFLKRFFVEWKLVKHCDDRLINCHPCQQFVEIARDELKYSDNTNAIDILSGLKSAAKKARL